MNIGNGALEVIRRFFGTAKGDVFLAWLWMQGYKVVPLDPEDDQ